MKHAIIYIGLSGVVFAYCGEVWGILNSSIATKVLKEVDCPNCKEILKQNKRNNNNQEK